MGKMQRQQPVTATVTVTVTATVIVTVVVAVAVTVARLDNDFVKTAINSHFAETEMQ